MKNALTCVLIACVCLKASVTFAIPSLETYGAPEEFSDVRISPSGDLLAYRQNTSDEKDTIIVYSLKEKKVLAGVDVANIDPQGHYFVNENYLIMIGSKHVKWADYKNDFDISTAFSYDFVNFKVEQLISLGESVSVSRVIKRGQTGLGNVVGKSPDGKELYIPAFVSEKDHSNHSIYSLLKVNIDGSGRPRITSKGSPNTRDYFLDDQGNVLARELLNNKSNKHSIQVKNGRKWTSLYSYESEIITHNFIGLTSDFSQLIFSRTDGDDQFYKLSLADGAVKPIAEVQSEKPASTLIRDSFGAVAGVKFPGFSPSYKMLDPKLDARIQKIQSLFEGNSVYISDWSDDWKHIVVRVTGAHYPGDYFLFSEGKKLPKFLLSSRPNIKGEDINLIGTTTVIARDELSIPVLMTLPISKLDNWKNLPTVVMPHGGPAAQDTIGFDYRAQAFASRGYLVLQPQYRGSTGFGVKHYTAGWGEWGRKMQDDISDTLTAMIKRGYVDQKRVCIVGASYGGYAALAGVAFTPELYQCAVSLAGVSHLPKMLSADKSRYGKDSWILDYWNRSILAGDYDKGSLKALSPYYSAEKIQAPVLLLHGEDDTIVEYEQSKLMYKAIKKAKGEVKLIKLKNDDHYLQDAVTRTQAVKAMVNFVEKHIGH